MRCRGRLRMVRLLRSIVGEGEEHRRVRGGSDHFTQISAEYAPHQDARGAQGDPKRGCQAGPGRAGGRRGRFCLQQSEQGPFVDRQRRGRRIAGMETSSGPGFMDREERRDRWRQKFRAARLKAATRVGRTGRRRSIASRQQRAASTMIASGANGSMRAKGVAADKMISSHKPPVPRCLPPMVGRACCTGKTIECGTSRVS